MWRAKKNENTPKAINRKKTKENQAYEQPKKIEATPENEK